MSIESIAPLGGVPAPRLVAAADLFGRAAELIAADRYGNVWQGRSGEIMSGVEAARHLEATLALLDRVGWVRVYEDDEVDVDPESSSIRHLIVALLKLAGWSSDRRLTLFGAMYQVAGSGGGDSESQLVADRVLDLLLRVRTGAVSADADAWAGRRGRSFEELRGLLLAGAEFARAYGPKPAVTS